MDDMARDQEDLEEWKRILGAESGLSLMYMPISPDSSQRLLCDVSQTAPRPLVPSSWIRRVVDRFHSLTHAGGRSTLKSVRASFVWHGMSSDVLRLVRECRHCQASKIQRHIKTPLLRRPDPDRRFGSLNVDLVGPLPESEGFRYLFTVIDRYTKWVEAISLRSITATDCATALSREWIPHFGIPSDVTSDQGRQFVSSLWHQLFHLFGIKALQTTSYHPQANGLIERVHHILKERLMALSDVPSNWMKNLPFVLMGLRSAVRDDVDASPADLVLGAPLRLPGQFFTPLDRSSTPPSNDFVQQLHCRLANAAPVPIRYHGTPPVHVAPGLAGAQFLFVRIDAVKSPFTRPCEGPFRVLEPGEKTFMLDKAGKRWTVSTDRLKPAYTYPQVLPDAQSSLGHPSACSDPDFFFCSFCSPVVWDAAFNLG